MGPIKRSTYAGAGGIAAALVQYATIPPTVMKELLWLLFSINVSVDLAGFFGGLIVALVGLIAARLAPDQPTPPLPTEPGAK